MDEEPVRQRLAVAEFTLESAESFSWIAPVLATLSYAVRLSTWGGRPMGTSQIAEFLDLDRHAARRGLKRLEAMGWIRDGGDGWVSRPRDERTTLTPDRWGQRICILRRAAARLDGRTPPPINGGPVSDAEYVAYSRAFIGVMKHSVGPVPTRFDDAYILAAIAVSSHGRIPLGVSKISTACRIPRTSVGRRLREFVDRGWVERRDGAYLVRPEFDQSPARVERLARRVASLRAAIAELDAAQQGQSADSNASLAAKWTVSR